MATEQLGAAPSVANDLVRKTDLDAHINDTTAAHAASAISTTALTGISATDVQAVLAELIAEAFPVGWGAWTGYTPTWTQSATVTKTVTNARYIQVGKLVIAVVDMVATGAGTASNRIDVSLPVTSVISASNPAVGSFLFSDVSASTSYAGSALLVSSTAVCFRNGGSSTNNLGATGGGFTAAIASGDIMTMTVAYEAA